MKLKFFLHLNLLLLPGIFLFSSCKEFIEPSIDRKFVQLNAPVDNYESPKYAVNFWWDHVEDALGYRLQIVTPKFDSIASLVVDTVVTGDKFSMILDPGEYQWRVSAENGSSQTAYTTRSFTVLETSLDKQTVLLLLPVNNRFTNQSAVRFEWKSLFGAAKYRLQIDTNNFENEGALLKNEVVTAQQFNFTFLKEAEYKWRVRAQGTNETEVSKWSETRSVTFDKTPPAIVTLISPANNASVDTAFIFSWNQVNDAKKYRLYVYKDSPDTPYDTSFPKELTTTTYSFSRAVIGETIYWKVTAVDEAGNESLPSVTRNVKVE